MILTKVRIGNKKEKISLKPLSEKEIQRKLYGSILSSTSVEEAPEPRWMEPPKFKEVREVKEVKDTKEFKEKEKKPVTERPWITLPETKINISIPWKKIGAACSAIFKTAFGLGKVFFSRLATAWGMGALIVAVLFISVHSLNTFRTKAMKAPKQDDSMVLVRKAARQKAAQVKQETKVPESTLPPSPVVKERASKEVPLPAAVVVPGLPGLEQPAAVPPVSTQDAYVIQVCTYASQTDAEKLIEGLKGEQLSAFFQSSTRSSGKTFYLVFLGRFKDLRESQARLKEFRSKSISKSFSDSFIRTLS